VLVLGWLLVVGIGGGAVWWVWGRADVDTSAAFVLPGGVPLPGTLKCTLGDPPGIPREISLPEDAAAVTALTGTADGEVFAGDEDGRLYRGPLSDGALQPWGPAPAEPAPVRALGGDIAGDWVFVGTDRQVQVLDAQTGEVAARSSLPAGSEIIDVVPGSAEVYVVDRATDGLYRAVWAYDELGEFRSVRTATPLPGLGAGRMNTDQQAILISGAGGLSRLATGTLRPQSLPLGADAFVARDLARQGRFEYVADGEAVRVAALAPPLGVTGRITAPIDVPGVHVTALATTAQALIVTGRSEAGSATGPLTVTGLAECNLGELARSYPTRSGSD
jgi:hypothetical protein